MSCCKKKCAKPEDLLGGGVLKKQFSGITSHFGKFDTSKHTASIKSVQGDDLSIELSGERTHSVPAVPASEGVEAKEGKAAGVDASAKFIFNKKNVGVDVLAKASGHIGVDVSFAKAIPYSTVKASAEHKLADGSTTIKSNIDFKLRNVTAAAAFEYPLSKGLKADLSAVADQSGFSFGGRVVLSSCLGADAKPDVECKPVNVDDYEVALGYSRDRFVAAVAATNQFKTVSVGVGAQVNDKLVVSGVGSVDLANKYKPSLTVGGQYLIKSSSNLVRVTGTVPTGDVAVQLTSKLFRSVAASVTVSANVPKMSHEYALSLKIEN